MIRLFDSLTGELRPLALREPGRVGIYVCGPTVYDFPHLGHGRFTLVWDVLRRWLTFEGLEVTFVSNITDIDDNIIRRATERGVSEPALAAEFEGHWWDAMAAIGVATPDATPHATDWVPQMVALIEWFLLHDIAYRTSDGVYFDVSRVDDYGALAGQPLDSLRAGARVEANDEKRSPLDFALWKNAKPGEPSWPAPFGDGRPGWHTECVVMSLGLLGEGFDLHCGGLDLKFPHHENERAQAVAAGRAFARHWGHNGWVMVGDQKMSKSLGNFTSLTDLLAQTDARAYRLLVLRSHYRSPIEVSPDTIGDAERALARLDTFARRFSLEGFDPQFLQGPLDGATAHADLVDEVRLAMRDDLDTPRAVAALFGALAQCNARADEGREEEALAGARVVATLFGALGLELRATVAAVDETSGDLARARDAARAAKEWARADELRDQLTALGWTVEDGPEGTVLRKS